MKAVVIGIKYTDSLIEARLLIPQEFAGEDGKDIKTIGGLEQEIISISAQTMEWLKIAARDKKAKIILYVNDKIIFAEEPDMSL